MRAKLNHVKMMMMMVKLYIRYISADVFVILLSSAASSPSPAQGRPAQGSAMQSGWQSQISSLGGLKVHQPTNQRQTTATVEEEVKQLYLHFP